MIVANKSLSEGTTAFMLNVYLNNINKQYNLGVKIHKSKFIIKIQSPNGIFCYCTDMTSDIPFYSGGWRLDFDGGSHTII